jgi:para-nitrobenzyl esterase
VPGGDAPAPVVATTACGDLAGVVDRGARAYKGVPYAAPPVAALRWAPPAPAACGSGARDASAFGPACVQLDGSGQPTGDEDCLTLNVWAPDAAGPPRQVLVFVHGGGNIQGSSSVSSGGTVVYDGAALAVGVDAVVVTLNYRLGAFGFLALATGALAGNYGILDQIAALEWVQHNIAAFGGDPARVTLFGESAGAQDVGILVASPRAKGHFGAAILESGFPVASPRAAAEAAGARVVSAAGCAGVADPVTCMRALPAATVVLAVPAKVDVAGKSETTYQPMIDGSVLPDAPYALVQAGKHNHVRLAIGSNAEETSKYAPAVPTGLAYAADVQKYAQAYFPAKPDATNAILAAYPVESYATPRQAFVALTTDHKFICSARLFARAAAGAQAEPVYRYLFAHALENGGAVVQALGAWHGLELPFLFRTLGVGGYIPTAAEESLAAAVGAYWAGFAAGAPAGWPAYDVAADRTLRIDDTPSMVDGVRTQACDFWETLLQ